MKKIIMVGGSKGGVGKSMVSISLIDTIVEKGEKLLVIESDTSNPDVGKIFKDTPNIQVETFNLDNSDGWIELVNICDLAKDATVVVNTAARNNTGMEKYGETLRATLPDLKRELITLWVINRQRDSLELLRSFLNTFPAAMVHVVRNNYFGAQEKFELYNSSKTKEIIESKQGKSLDFPELADRVSDDIYSKRLSIQKAIEILPLGNKAELIRWRNLCKRMFEQVI